MDLGSFFGCFLIINSVRFPDPGPISSIVWFFRESNEVIFFIILLSDRKFCPKDFLSFNILVFKKFN